MSDSITLAIDENNLTIGDLEDFEELVGKPLNEAVKQVPVLDEDGKKKFDEKGRPEMAVSVPAKALRALVWISHRKINPEFTAEDARDVRVAAIAYTAAAGGDKGND